MSMKEKREVTEDEAREILLRYYVKPVFEANELLKMVRRAAGNKNASEFLEALKVVFLSDISACRKEILQGIDKMDSDGKNERRMVMMADVVAFDAGKALVEHRARAH